MAIFGPEKLPYSSVLQAVKREFSRSVIVDQKLKSCKIVKVKYKKDGSKSRVPDVFYPCAHCTKEFKRKDVQVDHVEPVVPVQIPAKHMSWDVIIEERCFVGLDGLQVLCKPCHLIKSNLENAERRKWRLMEKHIVYLTVNMVNGKRYIGVHKCVDLDDGYLGSGTILKKAIAKHGKASFYRKVLYCYDNAKDAYNKEQELVNNDIVNNDF
jgi:hypothetical protein